MSLLSRFLPVGFYYKAFMGHAQLPVVRAGDPQPSAGWARSSLDAQGRRCARGAMPIAKWR